MKSFFKGAFDYEMTLDTLQKVKAGETVKIPIYDAVNAKRYSNLCVIKQWKHTVQWFYLQCTW